MREMGGKEGKRQMCRGEGGEMQGAGRERGGEECVEERERKREFISINYFVGHPNTALALLKRGVPLMMPNKNGAISLHSAARYGHASVVKALLNKGAAVDSKTKVTTNVIDV